MFMFEESIIENSSRNSESETNKKVYEELQSLKTKKSVK